MKNTITFLLLLFVGVTYSQDSIEATIQQSNVIGGSFFLSSSKNNTRAILTAGELVTITGSVISANNVTDTKYSSFNFSPYYGRRLSPNWLVGIIGGYERSSYKTLGFAQTSVDIFNPVFSTDEQTLSETKTMGYDFGIFGRYYFNGQSKLQFFIEPRITWNSYDTEGFSLAIIDFESLTNENSSERRVIDIRLIPGLNYTISHRFNILISAGIFAYQVGSQTNVTRRDNRLIDRFNPSPIVEIVTDQTKRDVQDLTLSLRTSNLYLGFEYIF